MKTTKKYLSELSTQVIGSAIEVHKYLGPGLLEGVYQRCLVKELRSRRLNLKTEQAVPLFYKGEDLDYTLRLDIVVEDILIIEIKAVEVMIPLYTTQLLTYLKLMERPKGLLINFNCENLTRHMVSLVTERYRQLPEH